jgi:hypothetical protein
VLIYALFHKAGPIDIAQKGEMRRIFR